MVKTWRNAIVGQSGGPTSVINATLAGVVKGALECGDIHTVYGMKNGIDGFLREDLISLNFLSERDLNLLKLTPASALGSCRVKLSDDNGVYEKIFHIMEKYNIGYFFYIGGNDSMDTVAKLSRYAVNCQIDVKIIGVPKTVDNDLVLTDHTPGYGSSSKYVATTVLEISRDILSYNKPSVTVVEIMGRDTGWLTCAAALPKEICGVGCDLVYLPEANFSSETFLNDVENQLSLNSNVLCAVSEGIGLSQDADRGVDQFGHRFLSGTGKYLEGLVRKNIGCKVRSIELNLPQRCSSHLTSRTDATESYKIGFESVVLACEGLSGISTGFKRLEENQGEYGVEVIYNPASEIANKIKYVPENYINSTKNGVTDKCIEYLYPLIQGEVDTEYKNGLPLHFRFR